MTELVVVKFGVFQVVASGTLATALLVSIPAYPVAYILTSKFRAIVSVAAIVPSLAVRVGVKVIQMPYKALPQ